MASPLAPYLSQPGLGGTVGSQSVTYEDGSTGPMTALPPNERRPFRSETSPEAQQLIALLMSILSAENKPTLPLKGLFGGQ